MVNYFTFFSWVLGCILVGMGIGISIYKLKRRLPASARKALNNPEMLAAELNRNGKIQDQGPEGQRIDIIVGTKMNPITNKIELSIDRVDNATKKILEERAIVAEQTPKAKPSQFKPLPRQATSKPVTSVFHKYRPKK